MVHDLHVRYIKDSSNIHLLFKAIGRVVVPESWGIGGKRWRRRQIPGSLCREEGVEQPVLLVVVFMGKSLFIWTKNEIMLFIINNQARYIDLSYLQVLCTSPHVPSSRVEKSNPILALPVCWKKYINK